MAAAATPNVGNTSEFATGHPELEAWSSYAATACTGIKGKVGTGIAQDLGTPFQASSNIDFIETHLPHAVSDITQGWDGSFKFSGY
ncbi:hypothetical protein C2S53_019746 [Perilla frutescens var. hirtella]|uniref:Uncharacterized protein n=1 Tax=Perilla frutescens var. hirtella TaxID=608512 RepID=A0AAD4P335_PERFH|nr:hypothetical protein C2S53_019746 [Perilla frutescens var. hirtella]